MSNNSGNENKNISNTNDTSSSNKEKKSFKEQLVNKTQDFLNVDQKIATTNNTFNFGKVLVGLFILIGFIIVVYSIFAAVVGESNTHAANIVFIIALICASTLVGIIFHYIAVKK
jgi:uncharacterized membrane protein